MDNLTTRTKIITVYGCTGTVFHVISGIALLKHGMGYRCPYCGTEVYDISDTDVGRSYLAFARVDLNPPPPLKRHK